MDAFIFDFDGLLIDTEWPAYVTAREVFEAHGAELTLERWQHRLGRGDNAPWTQMLADDVGDVDHATVDEARRRRKNDLTDAQPLLPGVVRLLEEAEARKLRRAVASSSPMGWVGPHLERLEIAHHFSAVLTSDQVDRTKPWPDLFIAACASVSVEPARAVAFEDSVHGVTAAKDAGMFCVAVPNRVTAGGDFSHADVVLGSLAELDLGVLGLA